MGQAIVDLITDNQKSQQWTVRPRPEVNRLHESLVKMMCPKPPMAGRFFVQGPRKMLLRHRPRKAWRFGMQSDRHAIAIDQHQQIAARQLPHILGSILNCGRIMRRHDGPCNRQVGDQFRRVRQHDFTIVLKILERCHRIPQLLCDPFPHMTLHAVLYYQQAQRCEAGRDQYHRQQKARPQPRSVYQGASGVSWESLRDGFGWWRQEEISAHELVAHSVDRAKVYRTGRGSRSSFWRSFRMWLSTVRVEG